MKKISIFGSTGSIGKNTVEVIKNSPESFEVVALIAKNDVKTLISQALLLKPSYVVIENEKLLPELKESLKGIADCQALSGPKAILDIAKIPCDLVVAAIVGFAGMLPTLEAIKAGSNIALANKESLVCAGKILIEEARARNIAIIPIDSEHNAIFQIFEKQNLARIENVILTASGGPFFNNKKDLKTVTISEALKHPNWSMGAKISIDSATMMNKGLEMIEAYHLFPLRKDQIKVLVHPQSIVHGLVNYDDGSSLAMLSLPDMKTPISYALSYPNRMAIKHETLNLAKLQKLEFFEVDEERFFSVRLCREVLEAEGNAPVVLNAANEIAVDRFLKGEIGFDQILTIVERTLEKIPNQKMDDLNEILEVDLRARRLAGAV